MRRPVIIGWGYTSVGEHWDKDIIDLAVEAISMSIKNIDINEVGSLYVGNMLSKYLELQASLAMHIANQLNMTNIYPIDIEVGEASGLYAIIEGAKTIMSGIDDFVIAGGVEKASDELPSRIYRGVSLSEDIYLVDYIGLTKLSIHALAAKLYMKKYGVDKKKITYLSVLDHENASKSRHAHFRSPISIEKAINAPLVADPLTLFDIAPNSDGAAFVLMTYEEKAREYGLEYIPILGFGSSIGRNRFYERSDKLWLSSTHNAFKYALNMANISTEDIDIIELHDSTSIAGVLALEAMEFHPRGEAAEYIWNGSHSLDGERPINTFGGLKARGNPIGATGAYSVVEIVMQLLNMADDNQVNNANIGLAHSMDGLGNSSSILILGRR